VIPNHGGGIAASTMTALNSAAPADAYVREAEVLCVNYLPGPNPRTLLVDPARRG
jgi:hypothetical protein